MKKLIEEMQKMLKEEKIRFSGVIELEQGKSAKETDHDDEKNKNGKRVPIEVKRSK